MYVYIINCLLIVKDGFLIVQCIIVYIYIYILYYVFVLYLIILLVFVVFEMRIRCILLFLYDIIVDIVSQIFLYSDIIVLCLLFLQQIEMFEEDIYEYDIFIVIDFN